MIKRWISHLLSAATALVVLCTAAAAHTLVMRGNRITVDGKRGQVLYRSCGDMDGDGRAETAFAMLHYSEPYSVIVVGRRSGCGWQLVDTQQDGYYSLRTDVTDVNGDGRCEVVARGMSGDGHKWCRIYSMRGAELYRIGDFSDTRFRDLSGDGVPEVLSISMVSAGFIGDHWLTIYKWNGRGYTDVSRRYPREYDRVIRDLRRVIHDVRFTRAYGSRIRPEDSPDIFADLYYYLGEAYEYRGQPAKARAQYAIAYRLDSTNDMVADAFRRMNSTRKP